MKKHGTLFVLTMMLNFAATCQTTPPANAAWVDKEELRTLILSNEKGLRAIRINRILREENKILKENNALFRELVASKDSTIDNFRLQSHSLELVVNNQSIIISNKDQIIGDINARLQKSLAKIERQRKAKKWLITGGGVFGVVAVKWGPDLIKMILKR